MGVKVVRPTYLDKKTGKRCKLDYYVQVCVLGEGISAALGPGMKPARRRRISRTP